MKRFNDYSKKELAAFLDEEVERLIDIEVAFAGIKPVSNPTLKEESVIDIEPTETAYDVNGLLFMNELDALAVEKFPRFTAEYDYSRTGTEYKWLKPEPDYSNGVRAIKYYTKEQVDKVRDIIIANKKISEYNKEIVKEYNDFRESISSIREDVWGAVYEAKSFLRKLDQASATYQKHLSLADGDTKIAENFFREAYKGDDETINSVLK